MSLSHVCAEFAETLKTLSDEAQVLEDAFSLSDRLRHIVLSLTNSSNTQLIELQKKGIM